MGVGESPNRTPLEPRAFIDGVPAFAWSALPDGSPEFFNQRFLDYSGLSPDQVYADWKSMLHRDDVEGFERWCGDLQKSQRLGQTEVRFRRADGEYRWFQVSAAPIHDDQGNLIRWYGINVDIDERKRAEQKLRQSEEDLRTITDYIRQAIGVLSPDGTILHANRVALESTGLPSIDDKTFLTRVVHPDDADSFRAERQTGLLRGTPFELEVRLLMKNRECRCYLMQYNPLKDEHGRVIRWYVTATDIDDRKRAEQALRASETNLRLIVDSIPGLVCTMSATGDVQHQNQQVLEYFGKTPEELKNWAVSDAVHPDDLARVLAAFTRSIETGQPYDIEHRCRRADGVYRWFQVRALPVRNAESRITGWYILLTDIDDRKRAEQKLRQSEEELRTITDNIRQPIVVLAPDGTTLYVNKVGLDFAGITMDQLKEQGVYPRFAHPDDFNRIQAERRKGLLQEVPFELEGRLWTKGVQYRWCVVQYSPLKDEHGRVIRWYVTSTDIEDRKRMEEQLRNENLVLREEIDRSSMFEEIVGSSRPMRLLLKHVEQVAPADSTVLILGETGTGKELVARALHKRSKRANRAFVRVNCAAIPQSLIASELFGHERGAFTGALQRRLGRFEAADGGTLFLDEIGELPMETQISLLRVLQEREFERVGSNHPISVDVRLIVATNRDLSAAVAAGTFREDLFYRLNVFPIEVPPLRERKEDIPLLVEYFVDRYAGKTGKKITGIGKKSMELLQSYKWPGNIRELQNVIERSVIVCDSENLTIDENWLIGHTRAADSATQPLGQKLTRQEKELIESALAESNGRVSGPLGAAAKLGIPQSTLDSKIKALKINKYGFRKV